MAKINWCPLVEGGLIGPTTSIRHISNGQEEVIGEDVLVLVNEVTMDLTGIASLSEAMASRIIFSH